MAITSNELFERSKKVAPGGVHSPVRAFKSVGGSPLFFESGKGAFLTSVEGDVYTDFCMSFGPLILGHRDPEIEELVHEMVGKAWSFGACEPYSLELAEWVTQKIPWVEKLRFVSSGTEAVMSALRVARAATERNKILKFNGCYHGHVDSMLVKSGSGLAGLASSDSAGVSDRVAHDTIVVDLDDDIGLEKAFSEFGREIAAVIIEPLPANYGLLPQRIEFLHKIRDLAKANGALLIFDEVISGFRVALGGMAEITGIRPDLVTYGKVLGGGFPVGCYGGRKDLLDLVAPQGNVYQAGTLSANPIGMAAGLATLKKIERIGFYEKMNSRSKKFAAHVNVALKERGVQLQMTQVGSLFWFHPPKNTTIRSIAQIPAGHAPVFSKFFHNLLGRKIYLAPSGYEVGFLSWAHDEELLKAVAIQMIEAGLQIV